MQDWLQNNNDPDGNLAVQRDTALHHHLDPVFEEKKRLIVEVVRMLTELRKTPTNSSGTADSTYDAASAAYQNAKNNMITNDALIRGTLESNRAEFDNANKLHKAATTRKPSRVWR